MDLKSNFKKVLGVGLLGAAAVTNSTAYAADASVQVDIALPTVLVMYHYDTINLNVLETGLADFLVGGSATACSGSDYCEALPNPATVDVSVLNPTTNVNSIGVTDPGGGVLDTDIVLEDVVGVRALGCSTYNASYTDGGSEDGITITTGAITDIDSQSCTFGMTTGDLQFNLDFNEVTAGATSVQAVFDVTITGA
jgi:hypothetical protein